MEREWAAKYAKARAKFERDREGAARLLRLRAKHWRQLQTTKSSDPASATREAPNGGHERGAGSENAALTMAYRLLDGARTSWRAFKGAELVRRAVDGVEFKDGGRITKDEAPVDEQGVAA